jgi:hypothetical protein
MSQNNLQQFFDNSVAQVHKEYEKAINSLEQRMAELLLEYSKLAIQKEQLITTKPNIIAGIEAEMEKQSLYSSYSSSSSTSSSLSSSSSSSRTSLSSSLSSSSSSSSSCSSCSTCSSRSSRSSSSGKHDYGTQTYKDKVKEWLETVIDINAPEVTCYTQNLKKEFEKANPKYQRAKTANSFSVAVLKSGIVKAATKGKHGARVNIRLREDDREKYMKIPAKNKR